MVLAVLIVLLFCAACTTEAPGAGNETTPAATSPAASPTPTAATTTTQTGMMQNGLGENVSLTLQTLDDSRDYRYCELVFNYGDNGSDIYSTSPLAECSVDWWDNLDLEAVAEEFGADNVTKNGPQNWTMDQVGVLASEPVDVAGVDMVFGAHLPPGTLGTPAYEVFSPAKTQNLVWDAGKPVYELVDPNGTVYVMQGYKVPQDELATLADNMTELPDGWEYRVENLTDDLVMNLTPDEPIPSTTDEFDQIYIRIPEGSS